MFGLVLAKLIALEIRQAHSEEFNIGQSFKSKLNLIRLILHPNLVGYDSVYNILIQSRYDQIGIDQVDSDPPTCAFSRSN